MFSCTVEKEISEGPSRCVEGKSISRTEAVLLLKSENTHSILQTAKSIRDRFKPGPITYSPKVFINLINLCRDTCSYCTYKKEPTDDSLSTNEPRLSALNRSEGKNDKVDRGPDCYWRKTRGKIFTSQRMVKVARSLLDR